MFAIDYPDGRRGGISRLEVIGKARDRESGSNAYWTMMVSVAVSIALRSQQAWGGSCLLVSRDIAASYRLLLRGFSIERERECIVSSLDPWELAISIVYSKYHIRYAYS